MTPPKIRRALISVYDKTGIVDFARALVDEFGIEIISTGGTAKLLKESGIPVTLVEEVTGFPEMLDGRVKTLHPRIHAAILADRDNPGHMRQLGEQGIKPIDMVVVNLYPFEKTVADPNCKFEDAIEMIDIGGPCLLRAAAKNHEHVIPIVRRQGLGYVLEELREAGDLSKTGRMVLASVAFEVISAYDATVDGYLTERWTDVRCGPSERVAAETSLPAAVQHSLVRTVSCRYGENPHQNAGLYRQAGTGGFSLAVRTEGVDCSFNNLVDAHAALELCKDLVRESLKCGTGFQPVRIGGEAGFKKVEDEQTTIRNLPHIQNPGRQYFVTFRLKEQGGLAPSERSVVLSACRHWDGRKMELHAVVVMPDHVHLLLTPLEASPGAWTPLGEIVHSIKRHSARIINETRGASGALWQDEYFDRIMRNQKEFDETRYYIANNPVVKDLAGGKDYSWWWDAELSGSVDSHASQQEAHRLKTGATLQDRRTPSPVGCSAVFIKHTNACGVGVADDPAEAYRLAYIGDPNAAMGGILACSFPVDAEFATAVMDTYARWGREAGAGGFFVEVWIAPEFLEDAVSIIRTSKSWGERVRLLFVGDMRQPPDPEEREYKSVTGGMLVQTRDLLGLNEDQWKVVSKRAPSESEITDLRLAWLIAKHTKSNAISICKDGMLIGNGAGQMSRVMSCRIATWLAKENGHAEKLPGSAAASDAFFPFADGPKLLIDAGVTALIQPGGSKRDADTIKLCDERGVAMIHTGTRHFKH